MMRMFFHPAQLARAGRCAGVALALLGPRLAASTLEVDGGRWESAGQLAAAEIRVAPDATFTASGRVNADLTVHGTLSHRELAVYGRLDFTAGSVWTARLLDGDTADVLTVTGRVTGGAVVRVDAPASAVPVGLVVLDAHPSSRLDSLTAEIPAVWTLDEPSPGALALTRPDGDSDGDGLPDAWELAHFSSRTSADAQGDGDADGFVNFSEFKAGTLPADPASVLRIGAANLGGGEWRLTWPSTAGRDYRVVGATSVDGAFTNLIEQVTATPPTNTLIRLLPSSEPLYLRVELAP